ncbi:serine carboxypeptidase 1 [Phtheirospermum japonicum]|uniref:Carboxypeptidase n=1 Tax=Phtheirospermum japonicum TaxID=374723 RepID=A0A830CRD0_9LAMI|nr:serine carboxypeptidase 1 [Phtheirospermum japonicum]
MRKTHLFCYLALTVAIQIALSFKPASSAPEAALVTSIPGFNGTLPSKHYSGYVTLDESHGKKLFYYFVESERNSAKDPIVLWLNGGPGCSSFDGFVYEHGPFNFEAGKPRGSLPTLHLNPYSWSKVSSVLYLDSPTGVGFSYSGNESDYTTGDLKTASDSHSFLLKWFELYPEFISNPFYISGESYAGVYVPTLAHEVAQGIAAGVKPILNFKGYMVGNGVTDDKFDGNALVPFAHGMGLISDELFEAVEDLNIYDILEPCYHSTSRRILLENTKLPQSFRRLGETERPLPVRTRMFGRAWPLRAPVKKGYVPTWPQLMDSDSVPCTDDEVATAWLNNEAVRKAIHAESANVAGKWELCTDRISGDHDMCVPFTGSEAWTRSVGYKTVDEWRPWLVKDQVAGELDIPYQNTNHVRRWSSILVSWRDVKFEAKRFNLDRDTKDI